MAIDYQRYMKDKIFGGKGWGIPEHLTHYLGASSNQVRELPRSQLNVFCHHEPTKFAPVVTKDHNTNVALLQVQGHTAESAVEDNHLLQVEGQEIACQL